MFYDGDVLIFARHDLATEFYFRRFEANSVFRREIPTQILCEEKLPVSLRVNKKIYNYIKYQLILYLKLFKKGKICMIFWISCIFS